MPDHFDLKEIEKLIKLVEKSAITGLSIENNELKIDVRKEVQTVSSNVITSPLTTTPTSVSEKTVEKPKDDTSGLTAIKSPMVGTFYSAANPDTPVFVKIGDRISVGQTVCIIEAMKLFNEIDAEVSGTVERILVSNAQPVEYGQVLMLVKA